MQEPVTTARQADADRQTLDGLNTSYLRAVEACDVKWFANHLALDFMNTNTDGSLVDRNGFLAQVAKGSGLTEIEARDVIIRVLDDLAIIHARTVFQFPTGISGWGRYTDIWSKRDGNWLCIAAQVTRC
ncbi:MAG: nuclear transport factor 2 family protein [Hyphomicrobiaceae bacterium]